MTYIKMKRRPVKGAYVMTRKGRERAEAKRAVVRMGRYGLSMSMNRMMPNQRYSSGSGRSLRLKTVDWRFTGAAANAYTVDTEPFQRLNLSSATDCVQSVTNIQNGAAESQRIGNKVALKSLRLKLALVANSNIPAGQGNYRVMVIYDRNPNGTYQAASTILQQALQSGTLAAGLYTDDIAIDFLERYIVLMNEFHTFGPLAAVAAQDVPPGPTDPGTYFIERYIKLNGLECVYGTNSNPGLIGNSQVGSLQILTFGNQDPGTTPWNLVGSARLRFHDT